MIATSFLQTYLLDGYVKPDIDAALKAGILAVTLAPVFSGAEILNKIVAIVCFAWLLLYVTLLFTNVRT